MALLEPLSMVGVLPVELFYATLEKCGDLKSDYTDYISALPIDCEREILNLPFTNYDTCCALLTTLLQEDHFSAGSFQNGRKQMW